MSEIGSLEDRRRQAISSEAQDWVLRLMDAPQDDAIGAACAAWREADPVHDDAFWQAWKVWVGAGQTDVARSSGWRAEAEALRVRPSLVARFFTGRSKGWKIAMPTGLAASLAAAVLLWSSASAPALEVATRVAETRVVALSDGSKVTVGGKSTLLAFTDPKARRVKLEAGQAFFEVAHDPAHPFVVVAGDAEITVRGTKFDVRRIGEDVQVNVLEGRVEVRRRGVLTFLTAGSPDAVLTAGQASELRPAVGAFAAAAPAATGAGEWRSGRLFYDDAPLADILADARRYSNQRIILASGAENLSLTVSYRAGDIDGLIDSIEAALPVRIEKRNDGVVVIAETP